MTSQRAQTLTRPTNNLEHDDTEQWWDKALCYGRDPSIWEEKSRITEARKICRDCPVATMCVKDAIDADDYWHTRGGLTSLELRALARAQADNPATQKPAPILDRSPEAVRNRYATIRDMVANGHTRRHIIQATGLAYGTVDDHMRRARAELGIVVARTTPAACGTDRGYERHRRDKETPCDPCRHAHSEENKRRRHARAAS